MDIIKNQMEVLEFKNTISGIMNSVYESNRLDSDEELVNWKIGQKEIANGSTETRGQTKQIRGASVRLVEHNEESSTCI